MALPPEAVNFVFISMPSTAAMDFPSCKVNGSDMAKRRTIFLDRGTGDARGSAVSLEINGNVFVNVRPHCAGFCTERRRYITLHSEKAAVAPTSGNDESGGHSAHNFRELTYIGGVLHDSVGVPTIPAFGKVFQGK